MTKRDSLTAHSLNIHPTAIVHPGAELGRGVEVGPFCLVGENVKLGEGTRLLANVVVNGRTTIGKHNEVHPFTVIGATSQDKKYRGESSSVRIGDRNVIREFVTIHRGTGEGSQTSIGDDNLLLAYVHIAHNCQIGNFVVMSNSSQLAGHVTVEDYAGIGGMVGVHQFVRIGKMSFIGGYSKLLKDVPPYFMIQGNPGYVRGLNVEGMKRRGVAREAVAIRIERQPRPLDRLLIVGGFLVLWPTLHRGVIGETVVGQHNVVGHVLGGFHIAVVPALVAGILQCAAAPEVPALVAGVGR